MEHDINEELVLDESFGFVKTERQEGNPEVQGLRNIEFISMSLDDFSKRRNCVVVAMTVSFLFL